MIDLPLIVYLGLLALMLAFAVRADFRRRAFAARLRQERVSRAALGKTSAR